MSRGQISPGSPSLGVQPGLWSLAPRPPQRGGRRGPQVPISRMSKAGKAGEVAEGGPVPPLLQGRWEVLVWGHQFVI